MTSRREATTFWSWTAGRQEWVAPFALAAASLAWNLGGTDFPWSFHPEEARWVGAVDEPFWQGTRPGLLAQICRLLGTGLDLATTADLVKAGRVLSALFASLSVLLLWRIFRDSLNGTLALFSSAVITVSPLFLLSAHYFTADSLLLLLCLASILCLARSLESAAPVWSVLLGVSMGLAIATSYAAAALIPIFLLGPRLTGHRRQPGAPANMLWCVGIAFITFLLINPGILLHPITGATQLWGQIERGFTGHHLYVSAPSQGFSFYLVKGLAPALTVPVLGASLVGLCVAGLRWSRIPASGRLTLLYGLFFYTVIELSPRKPEPESLSYVLATLPALGLGTGFAIDALSRRLERPSLQWLPLTVMGFLLAFPALRSMSTITGLNDDTRQRADRWVEENPGRVLRELHSSARPRDVVSLTQVDLDSARRAGVTHVVASSFVYDTFARGSRLANQKAYVYQRHERYQELFEYPYQEFAPTHAALGWSNPTIRIIDIRKAPPPGRP